MDRASVNPKQMVQIHPLPGEVPMPMAARSQGGVTRSHCSKYSLGLQVSVTDHGQEEPQWPNHSSSVPRAKAGAGHSFGTEGQEMMDTWS